MTNEEIINGLSLPADVVQGLASSETEIYNQTMNAFLPQVLNKIVYQRLFKMSDWENPFKKFDGFNIEYGDTIENIYTQLPQGYKFNRNATDPFTKVSSEVKTLYATINYEMQYCVTIERDHIRRMVLGPDGLQKVIDYLLSNVKISMDLDEYEAQLRYLNNPDLYAGGFRTLDLSTVTTKQEAGEKLMLSIMNIAKDMRIPTTAYNKLGVKNTTSDENLLLVVKANIINNLDFKYLTGLFNLDKAQFIKDRIEVRTFKITDADGTEYGEDIDFLLLDKRGFDNHVALRDGGNIYNPKGRYTNSFTDLWKIFGYKNFFNALAFKITDPNKYVTESVSDINNE